MQLNDRQIAELWLQSQVDEAKALVRDNRTEVLAITVGQKFDGSGRHRELLDAAGIVAVDALEDRSEVPALAGQARRHRKESRMFLPDNEPTLRHRDWVKQMDQSIQARRSDPYAPSPWMRRLGRSLQVGGFVALFILAALQSPAMAIIVGAALFVGFVLALD